ncbi:unknown [Prevotella sp. CAG:279]|nr:unknown [Prevotella sp. CAG:279]
MHTYLKTAMYVYQSHAMLHKMVFYTYHGLPSIILHNLQNETLSNRNQQTYLHISASNSY